MNKLWLNSIRLMKKTKGRFISLTAIVAIGVSFFVGVSSTSQIMGRNVDAYNDEYDLKDITIYSNYGFNDADLEALSKVDGLEKVEGKWFADCLASSDKQTLVTRIHSFEGKDEINRFSLVEGRLPNKPNEALAERGVKMNKGFSLGDTIHVSYPNQTKNESLLEDEFKIVGLVDTPLYLNFTKENSTLSNQYIVTYLYVLNEAFDQSFYLEVDATVKDAKELYSFEEKYEEYTKKVKENIKDLASIQKDKRLAEVKEEALKEYEDGYQKYLDAIKEYEESIDDAKNEIDSGEKEIVDGEQKLKDAEKELEEKRNTLNTEQQTALAQLDDAKIQLNEAEQEFLSQKDAFLTQKETMQNQIAELEGNRKSIEEGLEKVQSISLAFDPYIQSSYLQETTNLQDYFYHVSVANQMVQEFNLNTQQTLTQLNTQLQYKRDIHAWMSEVLKRESDDTRIHEANAIHIIAENYPQEHAILLSMVPSEQAYITEYRSAITQMDQQLQIPQSSIQVLQTIALREHTLASHVEVANALQQILTQLSTDGSSSATTIAEIQAALAIQKDQLTSQKNEVIQGINQIQNGLQEAEAKINEAEKEIESQKQALQEATVELNETFKQAQLMIDNGAGTIAENRKELDSSKDKIKEAKVTLEKATLEGKNELDQAKKDLEKAKKEIDELEENQWTVLDRSEHYASATFKNTVKQMRAIGNIFPLFFILVAALVCLTTMTRLVAEQRGEIGILRALGYGQFSCMSTYLIYAGLATIMGCIIGSIIGIFSFPIIIYNTWKMMYALPPIQIYIPYRLILLSSILFMASMLLTTFFVCHSDMHEVPSQLMRPKSPKLGKSIFLEKIPFFWKQLSFNSKVTLRNIFRYKKRFMMTVIGVAGCTALLLTGFGIRDSINEMVNLQFEEIYHYDGQVSLKRTLSNEEIEQAKEDILAHPLTKNLTYVHSYSAKALNHNGLDETVLVQVFKENEDIHQVYDVRNRISKEKIQLDDEGIIINEKLAENMNVKVGDSLSFEAENGEIKAIPISAITEMYVRHYLFISESCYERYFGSKLKDHSFLIELNDESKSEEYREFLVETNGVEDIEFFDTVLENFKTTVKSLDLIVLTLILSSMSLAFVVLGNLIHVNISEREREIATLKVLGFRKKEVAEYIYKENNLLVILGSIVGLPIGNILHHFIMHTVEMDYIMYGRDIKPLSFLLATLLTIVFGFLVDLMMRKKLDLIKMVESLKSVE